jgi:murein DD-endopeptidase MepM/ murein hydrolase activator NlpD
LGATVTYSVTVTSSTTGIPTGTVTYYDGTTPLATIALSPGSAVYSTNALSAGLHTITASYSGDASFLGSTSSAIEQTIYNSKKFSAGQVTLGGIPLAGVPVIRLSGLNGSDPLAREEVAVTDTNGYYFFTTTSTQDYIVPVSSGAIQDLTDVNQGPRGYIFAPEFCQAGVNNSRLCATDGKTISQPFEASPKPSPLSPPIILKIPLPAGNWRLVTEAGGYTLTGGAVDADPSHTDLSSGFYALDIGGTCGTPILAPASGVVVTAQHDPANNTSWGNTVVIEHADGLYTRYAHLHSITVNVGDTVAEGQVIGLMGSTGLSFGPHVHFQIYDGESVPANSQSRDSLLRRVELNTGTTSLAFIEFASGSQYQSTNASVARTVSCKK